MGTLVTEAAGELRATGGRMTAQRRTVLEALESFQGHPTAEQVYLAARKRNRQIHPATVYRTLGWLAECGLVSAQHLDAGRSDRCGHFEAALPATAHAHFVCTNCEQVMEFDSDYPVEAETLLASRYGVSIERASLVVYGLCATCREEGGGA